MQTAKAATYDISLTVVIFFSWWEKQLTPRNKSIKNTSRIKIYYFNFNFFFVTYFYYYFLHIFDRLWFCYSCRLTLLLGPPSSGKTTLLLALAGRLGPGLQVLSFPITLLVCYIKKLKWGFFLSGRPTTMPIVLEILARHAVLSLNAEYRFPRRKNELIGCL